MRIYTNGRSAGISMGPIGWLLFAPFFIPAWLFVGFLRLLSEPRR